MPVYNAEAYLEQCLQSIACQTYEALQVIVVDDGSTDASLRLAQQTAAQDERFVVLHEDNKGQSAARNRALQHATGDFVAFVDADDRLDKDYLATLHAAIGTCDMVQGGYRRLTADGRITSSHTPKHRYQYTVPWGRLYRRELLDDIRFPEGMIYEDVIFSLQLWAKRPRCICVPYTGYQYRQNQSSTTARVNRPAQQRLFAAIRETKAPWWLKTYTYLRLKIHFIR